MLLEVDHRKRALSFPTYAGIIGRAAYRAATELGRQLDWQGKSSSDRCPAIVANVTNGRLRAT